MKKHNILITDGLASNGQAILQESGRVDVCNEIEPDALLEIVPEYHAMIVRSRTKVTAEVIEAARNLRVIGRAGVGVDNIDLAAAKSRGVAVVNAPEASSGAVAELTLGLMLSLARHLAEADRTMKRGVWAKKQLRGTELAGKTLGVIGVGRIGSAVAHVARCVGMEVIGYDPYVPGEELQSRSVLPSSEIDPIYRDADYITYHVPLTEQTRGAVNAESFARMKPGVRIICTARGGVIDEADLLEALDGGRVGGAALDVFEKEPPGASALVTHPRVIATPHIGAQTEETQARVAEDIAREVMRALHGEDLRWRVV